MMTEEEYQKLKNKIEREFPLRLKLAELAGLPKINPKNYNALMSFDLSVAELFMKVALDKPENMMTALSIIRGD